MLIHREVQCASFIAGKLRYVAFRTPFNRMNILKGALTQTMNGILFRACSFWYVIVIHLVH